MLSNVGVHRGEADLWNTHRGICARMWGLLVVLATDNTDRFTNGFEDVLKHV